MVFDMRVVAAVSIAIGLFLPFSGLWKIVRAACIILGVWIGYDELRG